MCPYGFPNGKFQDRPEQICHLGAGGCNRLITLEENLENFVGDYEDYVDPKLDNAVNKNKVSLSSELEMIAKEQCEGESPEQQVLKLAANIIKEQYDKDIVRVNDI